MKQRFLSAWLALCVASSWLPGTVFAADTADGELMAELSGYSEEYPNGGFAFYEPRLEAAEGEELYIDVVRLGAADSAASVQFKAVGVSAVYGEDYTLSAEGVFAARGLEQDEGAATLAELIANTGDDTVLGEEPDAEPEAGNSVEIGVDAEKGIVDINEAFSGGSAEKSGGLRAAKEIYAGKRSGGRLWQDIGGAENADAAALAEDMSGNSAYISEFAQSVPGTGCTLEFDEGEYRKRIRIDIIDDDISETDEQVLFLLTDAQGAELAKPNTAYLNIIDNDGEEKAVFSLPDGAVSVGADEGYAYINIERISGIEKLASVTVGTGAVTAEPDKDYRAGSAEVVFPQGVTSRTVKIPVYDAGRTEAVTFAVAIDGETAFADPETASMYVTIEPTDGGISLTSADGGAENGTAVMTPNRRAVYADTSAAQTNGGAETPDRSGNGAAGVIDGTVLLRDYPIFGEEDVIYTPVNGAEVTAGGMSAVTAYDESFGGTDGAGGDGYFKISGGTLTAGDALSVSVAYKGLTVSAVQNVNTPQRYILDAGSDISVDSAARAKNGKVLDGTEAVLSDDASYTLTFSASTANPALTVEKAALIFYGKDGSYITEREYGSTGEHTGIFECTFNPADMNLPAGTSIKVKFTDSKGTEYFERDTGVTLMQALGTFSLLTSFEGGAAPELPVIGSVSPRFDFGWDGTLDDASGAEADGKNGVVSSAAGKKILNLGLEFSPDGSGGGVSRTELKNAAKNGTHDEKKQAAAAADKGENHTKGQLASGCYADMSFGLTLTLAASGDPEHKGEWCFEEFILAANTGDGTDTSKTFVTPIGLPITVGACIGADGNAIVAVERRSGAAEYYMSDLIAENPGGVDIVKAAQSAADSFDVYGGFSVSIGLSASESVDMFDMELDGRADLELLFDAKTAKNSETASMACALSVKILFFETEYDLSSSDVSWFDEGANLHDSLGSFTVSQREHLKNRSGWNGGGIELSAARALSETTLMTGADPDMDIQTAALGGGKYIAVFIDDVPERTPSNSKAAFYSIYDGSSWSEPEILEDDGTADDSPAIHDLGNGKLFIAWSTANQVFGDDPDMFEVLNSRNIHGCFYDIASGELGGVIEVTKNTDEDVAGDYDVKLAYDEASGKMLIYYTKSEYKKTGGEAGLFGDALYPYSRIAYRIYDVNSGEFIEYSFEEEMEIKNNLAADYDDVEAEYAKYVENYYHQRFVDLAPMVTVDETLDDNGYWTQEPVISEYVGHDHLVVECDAISYNNLSLFAYILDYDGDKRTTNDRDIFLQIYDFNDNSFTEITKPIMITSNDVEEKSLQFERIGGNNVFLSYISDGDVKMFDVSSNISDEAVTVESTTEYGEPYYYLNKTQESGYIPERTVVSSSGGGDYTGDIKITAHSMKSGDDYCYILFTERALRLRDGVEPGSEEAAEAANNLVETQIYASRYGIADGVVTEPVRVTDEAGANYANVSFEVTDSGGFIALAAKSMSSVREINGTPVSTAGSGSASLCSLSFEPSADVSLRDAFIENIASGANAEAGFEVYNGGIETIEGLTVEVKDGGGNAIDVYNDENGNAGTISLTNGAYTEIRFSLPVADDANSASFTAVVKDAAGNELDTIEHSASVPRTADVVSFNADITERGVMGYRACVRNNGTVRSGEQTFRITAGGKTLYTQTLGSLAPGESTEISGEADIDYGELFESVTNEDGSVSAETELTASAGSGTMKDTLRLYASAEQMARLNAVKEVVFEDNKAAVTVGGQLELEPEIKTEGYSGRYEDNNEADIPALGVKLVYFTDDEDIVKVSQNGVIEGISEGMASVTAYLTPADSACDAQGYISDYPTLPDEAVRAYTFDVEVKKTARPVYGGGGGGTVKATATPSPSMSPTPTATAEPQGTAEPSSTDAPSGSGFADVPQSAWYSDAVEYVFGRGIMLGVSETEFAPEVPVTRGMLVTVLWRMEERPQVNYLMTFGDVPESAYYAEAVRWAASEGIVKGYSDSEFAPDKFITREEMAAVINRYADYNGIGGEAGDISAFADAELVSGWARGNMEWAVGTGIISGRDGNVLDPQGNTTRAETAAIMQRLLER